MPGNQQMVRLGPVGNWNAATASRSMIGTTFLEGNWQRVFEMHMYSDHKLYFLEFFLEKNNWTSVQNLHVTQPLL